MNLQVRHKRRFSSALQKSIRTTGQRTVVSTSSSRHVVDFSPLASRLEGRLRSVLRRLCVLAADKPERPVGGRGRKSIEGSLSPHYRHLSCRTADVECKRLFARLGLSRSCPLEGVRVEPPESLQGTTVPSPRKSAERSRRAPRPARSRFHRQAGTPPPSSARRLRCPAGQSTSQTARTWGPRWVVLRRRAGIRGLSYSGWATPHVLYPAKRGVRGR
jgi:hypothetical protein